MLNYNKIAVISTGNGGQSMAAYFASRGYDVALYARDQERVDMFRTNKFLISGQVNGSYSAELISCNIEDVIRDAHLIMVTTPAQYHSVVASDLAPFLTDGQIVFLNPGRTFGTCEFDSILKEKGCAAEYILGEAETFAFTCRCTQVGYPTIYSIKNNVLAAAHRKEQTGTLLRALNAALPSFCPADSVLHTGLSNIGMLFHPLPIIMNITRVERGEHFLYYKDGITPMVAERIEQLDSERLAVTRALGVKVQPAKDWICEKYNANGNNLYEAIQDTDAYSDVSAPTSIFTRYIFEDIPTGLVPMYCVGQLAGINTAMAKSVIDWASAIYGFDFLSRGRNNERINLSEIIYLNQAVK